MKIVFMGTPDFAVPCLQALLDHGETVVGVFTQSDKPKGRGYQMTPPPVKELAVSKGIPVFQPKTLRDEAVFEELKALDPELIVVVAYGKILPKNVLDLPKFGCINVHASLLPKYRGAGPIQWAILNGEKVTGVTTMYMGEGIDTGDMLEKAVVPLAADETGGSLHDKLTVLGAELILSTLDKLEKGTAVRTPQTDENTCYAKMLKKNMGDIDWTMDAVSIERLVRGLNPWPSAFTRWNGRMLKIWEAKVLPDPAVKAPCGSVISAGEEGLKIQTGNGVLCVTSLQLEGKKRMDTAAFLRGYQIEPGCIMERSE